MHCNLVQYSSTNSGTAIYGSKTLAITQFKFSKTSEDPFCPTRNVEIKLIEKSEPFSKGLLFLEVNGKMLTM
jgi:hypothetical protein